MNTFKKIIQFVFICFNLVINAQDFDANLQIRPRYEYRNGFKAPISNGESPTSFIAQRSRLNLNFKNEKLKLKLSLQNVRTWGDVTTTTSTDKNGVALFEGWAQYEINPKWSFRAGRQVISYDNERIFGEIDWIQQAQSHDAVLFTYRPVNHQLDLGFALNSNAENLVEPTTAYSINYKSMQYVWYHTRINKLNTSLLFLNTGYEFLKPNTQLEVDFKQTFGTFITFKENKWDCNLSLYGQTGKSNDNNVSAYNLGVNLGYAFTDHLTASVGYELLSGKNQGETSSYLKSFAPLFGTNHAFNGLMDYFFVGNHQNSVGLQDEYLTLGYTRNKWQFVLTPHYFTAPATVLDATNTKMDAYLGTEIDFTMTYSLQKDIKIKGGYSQMFATSTLVRLKSVTNPATSNNWAWLMVSFQPKIWGSTNKQ